MPQLCECCQTPKCAVLRAQTDGFVCQCADELWCKRCGHCATHCQCGAAQELDVPWTERLSIAKYELTEMGVKI
jgi:hypothetical protein